LSGEVTVFSLPVGGFADVSKTLRSVVPAIKGAETRITFQGLFQHMFSLSGVRNSEKMSKFSLGFKG
jgi:hypothetical protein